MGIIIGGDHYRALKQMTPKIFAGAGAASVDFEWEHTGGGVVEFTPIVTGDIQEYDWGFGDGSEHSSEIEPTHDYGDI